MIRSTVFAAACLAAAASLAPADEPPAGRENARAALKAGNEEFAFGLFSRLRSADGNVFFSPFSVSSALAMTIAGARGGTREGMAKALCLSLGDEDLHPAFGDLTADLNSRKYKGRWEDDPDAGRKPFELVVANSLWGQKGYPFEGGFRSILEKSYGAGLIETDFRADAEKSRLAINAWVEDRTAKRIKDLLARGMVGNLTRLVLVNAIYFKAAWAEPFEKSATKDGIFNVSDSAKVTVPFMRLTKTFKYGKSGRTEVLSMPYLGDELSMIVLLPEAGRAIGDLEADLGPQKLSALLAAQKWEDVEVILPRFRIESSFNLNEPLAGMGMKDAFDLKTADFSGMAKTGELFIGVVVHKAFVDVNEQGTEAAAATALAMEGESADETKPKIFRADRPFLFLLRDAKTSTILFMGRVSNPAK